MPTWIEIPPESARTAGQHRATCSECYGIVANCSCTEYAVNSVTNVWYVWAQSAATCRCGCGGFRVRPEMYDIATAPPEGTQLRSSFRRCHYCREYDYPRTGEMCSGVRTEREFYTCMTCYSRNFTACAECETPTHQWNIHPVTFGDGVAEHLCTPCASSLVSCGHCGRFAHSGEGPMCCDEDEDGYVRDCGCEHCCESSRTINSYSYKPSPRFKALDGEKRIVGNVDKTLYMGFELELEVPDSSNHYVDTVAGEFQAAMGRHVYLKSDGSINYGFEMVTHPATLAWSMEKINWQAIRDFRKARKIKAEDTCGLHVHVNRSTFESAAHDYRWLLFWHRNQNVMKLLADRDSHWAKYDMEARSQFAKLVKGRGGSYDRYAAINAGNRDTYEVRVFASTTYVNRLKAALQLVESTVEYTRHLASAKVMKDGGFNWGEYVSWLQREPRKYAQLLKRIADVVDRRLVDRHGVVKVGASNWAEYRKNSSQVTRWGYRDNIVIQEKVSL